MAMTLKAMRINRNMKRKEAAEKIGVTDDQLYNWESYRTVPNVEHVLKILAVYQCSIDDIDFLRPENTL